MTGDARGTSPGAGETAPSAASGSEGQHRPQADAPAAPLALYRRYRPATFAEVKGQEHVTEPLRQALRSGRVHHAYLFSGPRGCGKTSSARILARSLNCEQGPTPDPCGVCASCVALAPSGPGSIDVIEIDAASHGGVDDARDLRERAFYAPVSGRYKIYIIDEAHMVTREGFNALLKLVEEPPPHLKFVFATTEPDKVIATIRSRTHHYPFRLMPPAVLREHLEQILASENVPYEASVLPIVVRAGAGSARDALSVLDQLVAGSDAGGLRYDRAVALLGYTDDRLLDEVITAFSAGDGAAVFHAIDHVVEAGHDPRRFAADLLDRLRDLIVLSSVPDAATTGLIDAPEDRLEQMSAQASAFSQAALTRAAELISAGLVEMRGATSPRLLLELMCAQVLLPPATADSSALAARLDSLERRMAAAAGPGGGRDAAAGPGGGRDAAADPDGGRGRRGQGQVRTGQVRAAPAVPPPPSAHPPSAHPPSAAPPSPPPSRQDSAAPPDDGRPGQQTAGRAQAGNQPAGQRPARREASETPPANPAGSAAAPSHPPASTEAVRARWPDILEAVQGRRRVAWMLLSNATVQSLADGTLTIAFAKPGDAKGFTSSGSDKDLAAALSAMYGMSVGVATTIAGGSAPPRSQAVPSAGHGERPAESDSGRAAASGGNQPRGESQPGGGSQPRGESQPGGGSQPRVRDRSADQGRGAGRPWQAAGGRAEAAEPGEPEPTDLPAPDVLTGTDLIERELGGRVIQEIDGP